LAIFRSCLRCHPPPCKFFYRRPCEHPINYYHDKKKYFNAKSFSYNLHNTLAEFFAYQPESYDDNFNSIFNKFTATLSKIIDIHAPLKRLCKDKNHFTTNVNSPKKFLHLYKKKQKVYKTHFLLGHLNQKVEYKMFSNTLTKLKTNAERNYFDNQLKINQGDVKKTCELLRTLLPSKCKTSNQIKSSILRAPTINQI